MKMRKIVGHDGIVHHCGSDGRHRCCGEVTPDKATREVYSCGCWVTTHQVNKQKKLARDRQIDCLRCLGWRDSE